MQPIASLSPDAARALSGVCFDVDDTLTRAGVLDADAYASLFALSAAGLKLVALTGRPLGFAEVFARTWPIDAAVGENGAGWIARDPRGLRVVYWDSEHARQGQRARLEAIRERVARELPHVTLSSDAWARRCDLAFDVGEHTVLPAADVDRLLALLAAEGARTTVSSVHAHAQLGDHDKARGAAHVIQTLWQMPPEQAQQRFLFVGDSGNDEAPFAWFHCTAGVANVRRHLSRLPIPPRFVAAHECGAGFAEIARVLLARRAVNG